MSARDELLRSIRGTRHMHALHLQVPADIVAHVAEGITDAILTEGYSKRETVTQWGVAFVHNGAFFRDYHSQEAAQTYADEMNEVGAHMTVVSREYTLAIYGEWVTA